MIIIYGSKIVIKIHQNFLPCLNSCCFLRFWAIPASFSSTVVRCINNSKTTAELKFAGIALKRSKNAEKMP